MHHPTQQPMYFGDLFAEIEATTVEEPSIPTVPNSGSAALPPASLPPTQPSILAFDASVALAAAPLLPGASDEPLPFAHDEEDDGDDELSDSARAAAAAAAVSATGAPVALSLSPPTAPSSERPTGKRRKQELHRRHSKRYRDNLGELFHELEQILPQVVPDCKLKTKSQIIATSVSAVKQLKTEVNTLEMRYVMSSATNRAKWVEETVASAVVIQDAIEPFMCLLLGLQSWKHAELWMRDAPPTGAPPDGTFALHLERVTSATDPARSAHAQRFLEFVKGSQVLTFNAGDDSLVGRIATSLSPEWLELNNAAAIAGFKRGELALRCGLVVCFAVPFLVRGHVTAVVLFYDNTPRADKMQRVSVAQDLASAIGNCYGALAAKKSRGRVER